MMKIIYRDGKNGFQGASASKLPVPFAQHSLLLVLSTSEPHAS